MSTDLTRRVESVDQLTESFHASIKSHTDRMVGMEYERAPVIRLTGEVLPYNGNPGVERLMLMMAERFGWTAVHEGERVIMLSRQGSAVTLEPGGQFELSSAPHRSLNELCHEVRQFLWQVQSIEKEMGIALLGIGLQPFTPLDRIDWIPKRRYAAMREILPRRGKLAPVMMKQTAGIQVSLDFCSERDAMEMFGLTMRLAPLISTLFANSPLMEGKPNGYRSYRSHVWRHTDPDRCGLLRWALDDNRGFQDYINYVLDTPLMFIVREGEYIDARGMSFRRFMKEGFEGHHPTFVDWELALTQVFPEVRLKNYVEIRCTDSQRPSLALAIPALWAGLLYGEGTREAANEVMGSFRFEELNAFMEEGAKKGLAASLGRFRAAELAREIITIAREGLRRMETAGESRYLAPIEELARAGRTPADELLLKWEEEWFHDPARLVEYCAELPAEPSCASS